MEVKAAMPHSEEHRRKRNKNLALGGVLVGLVVLFFVLTIVQLGGAS